MNPGRLWKALIYPRFPSVSRWAHEKRRKGLHYRRCPPDALECQTEQDLCFWKIFLQPQNGGKFLEIGGDGVTGSHTLGLELLHGWIGEVRVQKGKAMEQAKGRRKCQVRGVDETIEPGKPPDLLAIQRPAEHPKAFELLQAGKLRGPWIVVENREPDPHWCRLLEGLGYKLKFFFHDDEYYQLKG